MDSVLADLYVILQDLLYYFVEIANRALFLFGRDPIIVDLDKDSDK